MKESPQEKHRKQAIAVLLGGAKRGRFILWGNEKQSCLSVLMHICQRTERGERFLKETFIEQEPSC